VRVAFAGGGIVGMTAAIALRERRVDVTVFEPAEPVVRTVAGSACYLSAGEIVPLPSPQLLADLPKLLFDRSGPLALRLAYLPQMLPWGMRFLAAARPANVALGIEALSSLNRYANDATFASARRAGAEQFLERRGGIHVARDTQTLAALRKNKELLDRAQIAAEFLSAEQLRGLEPALAPALAGGLFFPGDARVRDPERFGGRLAGYFREIGGAIEPKAVSAIVRENDGWRAAPSNERFTHVVVTAGAWSRELLRPLGYFVPLDTERGYNLTLPDPQVTVQRPIVFIESHVAVTPLDYGLRITGTVEFAGLQAPPDWRRADMLRGIVQSYFPGTRCDNATRWMGFRPALPDVLPAIGEAARHTGLFYAFGHEHLGFTQAAITAECLAALVTQERPPVDLRPFDLERFRR